MIDKLHLYLAGGTGCQDTIGGLPSLLRDIPCKGGQREFTSLSQIGTILGNLIEIILILSGSAAVIIIVGASIYYITSMGDAGRIKKAKDMIVNAIVGLIVILLAYAVVVFVGNGF